MSFVEALSRSHETFLQTGQIETEKNPEVTRGDHYDKFLGSFGDNNLSAWETNWILLSLWSRMDEKAREYRLPPPWLQ